MFSEYVFEKKRNLPLKPFFITFTFLSPFPILILPCPKAEDAQLGVYLVKLKQAENTSTPNENAKFMKEKLNIEMETRQTRSTHTDADTITDSDTEVNPRPAAHSLPSAKTFFRIFGNERKLRQRRRKMLCI